MRRLTVLAPLFACLVAGAARADEEKKIQWVASFEEGIKAAQEAKKPVFIDFTMDY